MNKHMAQIILTPGGERMAVLAATDYEAMLEALEDNADVAASERILRRIESGEEEFVPAEYADRIIDGENPIKVYREFRGMTTKALGEAAGVSQGYVSQIETGARQGTVDVVARIAVALKVRLDDLVILDEGKE